MSVFTGVIVYLLIYWTALFCVLPWGNKPSDAETPDPAEGITKAAPNNPRILLKFGITAVVSAVIWLIVYGLIKANVISFHDIARGMAEESDTKLPN